MIDSSQVGIYPVHLLHNDRNANTFGVVDKIINKRTVTGVIVCLTGNEERKIKAILTYNNENRKTTTIRAPFIDEWLRANSTPEQEFSALLEILPGGIHKYSQITPIR